MSVQQSPTNSSARPTTQSAACQQALQDSSFNEEATTVIGNNRGPVPHAIINPDLNMSQNGQSSLIQDTVSRFGPGDVLKADGTNYRDWHRELVEVAFSYLDNGAFFNRDQARQPLERIACSILLNWSTADSAVPVESSDMETSVCVRHTSAERSSSRQTHHTGHVLSCLAGSQCHAHEKSWC